MARHVAAVLRAAAVVAVALLVLGAPTAARKHRLRLVDEDRHFFLVSSFGLLRGGSITIRTSKLEVGNSVDRIGMSIHRSSEEATEFILDSQSLVACIFDQVPDDNTMRLEMNRTTGAFLPVHDNLKGLYVMTSESSDSSDRPVHEALLQVDGTGEDIYTVAFHMCSTSVNGPRASLQLDVVEVNPGPDYLGAGLAPLPSVYALMAVIFALLTALWVYVLITHRNSPNLFKVHYLMLAVVAVKTLSLAAHAADYHFIKVEGAQEEGWAVVWYILHFSKGLLLFLTVLLVGAGFGFVKHVLSDREKRLFAVIIALQVFGNIGLIVLEETSEGTARRETWRSIMTLVDLLCCGAILFPVVWSIRHLRDASATDGKAAKNLAKLRVFRLFYVMVFSYIYVTRIVVFLISSTIPFRNVWLGALFEELATLIFYFTTGLWFSPVADNPYMRVSTEDPDDFERIEMDEVVVNNGYGGGEGTHRKTAAAVVASVASESEGEGGGVRGGDDGSGGLRHKRKVGGPGASSSD